MKSGTNSTSPRRKEDAIKLRRRRPYLIAAIPVILYLFQAPNYAQDQKPVQKNLDSRITGVQLYSQQALITRSGATGLKQGPNKIQFTNLPAGLVNDSVQISVVGLRKVKIQEIRVITHHKKVYRSKEAKDAEKRLREKENQLRFLADEYSALKGEEKFLKAITPGAFKGTEKDNVRRVDPGRWAETLNFINQALAKNHSLTQSLLTKIDLAREELNVAITVAERYRSTTSLSKKRVHISMDAGRSGNCTLRLSYRIRGAGWYPIYTARVSSEKNKRKQARVGLQSYALVKNQTGEDWKNVRLHFSAANPNISASLPDIYEWRIAAELRPVTNKTRRPRRELRRRSDAPAAGMSPRKKGKRNSFSRGGRSLPSKIRQAEERVKPAPEPRVQSLNDDVRQSINRQNNISKNYYRDNKRKVKEKQARRKSDRLERNLRDFKSNWSQQERQFRAGNYKHSLTRSEAVIDNIRKLGPRYRGYFKEEEKRANKVRQLSLRLLEHSRIARRLVSPRSSSGGFDYRYVAAIRETIKSDGAFNKVFILKKNLNANLFFESAPVKKQLAFLRGEINYKDKTPLLAGPVAVFHNRDYLGEADLKNITSATPFFLNLGSDEAIQIDRKTSSFRVKSGLFNKSYVFNKSIEITVKNRKKRSITVLVYARVPHPLNDKVKVDEIKHSQFPDKKVSGNMFRYRVTLGPGKSQKIKISYRLSHPENVLPVYRESRSPRW